MQVIKKNESGKKSSGIELYVIDDFTEGGMYEHRQRLAVDKDAWFRYFANKQSDPKKLVAKKKPTPSKRFVKKKGR